MKHKRTQPLFVAGGLTALAAMATATHGEALKEVVTDEGVITVPASSFDRPAMWDGSIAGLGGWFYCPDFELVA